MELRGVAGSDESLSLGDFLQQVALVAETDNLDNAAQATTLLTLHAAKGLEFPIVFLTGLEEGLLPHSRSMDSEDELAEERRLFYVGMTRAKDRLYLSHVFRRSTWGDSSVAVPSRFLNDIPEELLEGGGAGQRRRQSIDRASTWSDTRPRTGFDRRPAGSQPPGGTTPRPATPAFSWDTDRRLPKPNPAPEPRRERPATTRFKTGQKVRHTKFGVGTVIESKISGADEEVTVAFPGIGIKRLAAGFAGLEIVN